MCMKPFSIYRLPKMIAVALDMLWVTNIDTCSLDLAILCSCSHGNTWDIAHETAYMITLLSNKSLEMAQFNINIYYSTYVMLLKILILYQTYIHCPGSKIITATYCTKWWMYHHMIYFVTIYWTSEFSGWWSEKIWQISMRAR